MPLSSGVGREAYFVKRKDYVCRRFTLHVTRFTQEMGRHGE
jgi:hypothetical protein